MNVNPVFFAVGYKHNGATIVDHKHLVQSQYLAMKRKFAYQKKNPQFHWEIFTFKISGVIQ